MVDTLHGWESRNYDLMSSRSWAQTGLSLEWFWANQIRKAKKRFADGGGEHIEYLVLQRIWSYKEKIFDNKRNNISDKMMRNIRTHANPEWREQRSICARILDSKKSRQDDKNKSWSCSRQLGQSDVEIDHDSKMMGDIQTLGKLCENS